MAHAQPARSFRRLLLPTVLAVPLLAAIASGQEAQRPGVAMIPKDAAFVSATLRLEEQWKLLAGSNAVASIRKLPAVQQALSQLEEQKLQPGSPLSMLDTYMQLPENRQLVDLLRDMVSADTFLYGEPSCVTFLQLIQKVQQAQNAANFITMARGDAGSVEIEVRPRGEADDDGAAAPGRATIVPVRRQVAELEEFDITNPAANALTARMVLQALADNADKIVVPDLVWGFRTTQPDAATTQIKRFEVLLKLVTQTQPGIADVQRRKVAGGEVVVFTVDGGIVPWAGILAGQEGVSDDDMEKVYRAFRGLDLAVSLGLIGDRVVLSIGDSADHLEKLVAAGGEGLVATEPFGPLRAHMSAHPGEWITAIGYVSEELARASAPSAADLEQLATLADTLADEARLPEGAAREARAMLERMAAGYKRRLPVPGPAMSYSFLTGEGYEGYAWDWSKNGVLDGSKKLDMLSHTGGTPLASLVMRTKPHPDQFDDFVSWGRMAWGFARTYLLPKADEDTRERVAETERQLAPLADRLVETLRTKFLPSLADGQVGFVIDSKGSAKRLQRDMPPSAEPLPLVEPAVALKLSDAKLFREGLSDLFEMTDDLLAVARSLNPESFPGEARLPEPAREKVEGGSLWTFALGNSGVDEQIRPSIAISDEVAVFSLAPKQASRLLLPEAQKTGTPLARFDEPLAGAAALDVAGLVDAIEPWILYASRMAVLQQRNGFVDSETVIGPDIEDGQLKDILGSVRTVLDALRCIRVAVADTATRSDATVTHWRNLIRDAPAK